MGENLTKPTDVDVDAWLDGLDGRRRDDGRALCALLRDVTGLPPTMWGPSMIGFGTYHYRYESGREGDTFVIGFAPRKGKLVVYLNDGFAAHEGALARLGPHEIGKGCLYLKRLDAVDADVLRDILAASYREVSARAASG